MVEQFKGTATFHLFGMFPFEVEYTAKFDGENVVDYEENTVVECGIDVHQNATCERMYRDALCEAIVEDILSQLDDRRS